MSLHLIFASALKVNQYPEFGTENFTYNEECGDRNNYKCWKKGGHSLDQCLSKLINPPEGHDYRTYSTTFRNDAGHNKSMLGNEVSHVGWVPANTNEFTDDDMAPYMGGYMTINLGREQGVVGVATQGRGDGTTQFKQWVSMYRVKISKDKKIWTDVETAAGTLDFKGNINNGGNMLEGLVTNRFPKVLAQYVRILIRKGSTSGQTTLRAGVVVC